MEPEFRCVTKRALDELAIELNLRDKIPSWDAVAGYSYTPQNYEDVQEYLDYYYKLEDDDKKFVLIEMILDAIVEQPLKSNFYKYWEKVKPLLIKDYLIHEYTIYYWKDLTEENFENCKYLNPLLNEIVEQCVKK